MFWKSQEGQANSFCGIAPPLPSRGLGLEGDAEGIRRKTLKISELQGIKGTAAKAHTGLETKESISEAQKGDGCGEWCLCSGQVLRPRKRSEFTACQFYPFCHRLDI